MAEQESQESTGTTVIEIPADKLQQVIEFVEGLGIDNDDVSGHMISRGGFGGVGGSAFGGFSGTICNTTTTGGSMDINCADTDFAARSA
jgi:hypothetical protein